MAFISSVVICFEETIYSIPVLIFYYTVGSPVPVTKIANPTQEEINQLHAQYLEALTDLYEKNKDKYHPTGTSELLII